MHWRLTRRNSWVMIGGSSQENLTEKSQSGLTARNVFVLQLLGSLSLHSDTEPTPVAARQKRPAGLLAVLGLAGQQGLSRERIEAYLWPNSSRARARHALDQVVYAVRQALGTDCVLSEGGSLRLNPDVLCVDIWELEDAMREGRWAAAVDLHKGPLLDGFHFADSQELESWIDTERAHLLRQYQIAVERLAIRAAEAGDYSASVTWWRRLATSDPLSAGRAKELMLALAAAGDRAGAVKHARLYQSVVRQELDIEPDAEVDALAATLSVPIIPENEAGMRVRPPAVAASSRSEPAPASSVPLPNGLPRIPNSRRGAVLSFAALVALLIGVVAVANQQWRNHPRRPAENTVRRASTIALPAARDAYLRAVEAWSDGSKAGLDTAVAYFRSATEVDRDYAEAYAGLADAYVMLGYFGYRPREEMFPKAKLAALRSMQLDSTLASAHPALAYELTWERDFAAADSEFRKAVAFDPTYVTTQATALDPTYAMAHQWYRILLMILGHKPETVVASRPAVKPNAFALNVPVVGLTFTKWFTTYPALTGFTGNGPGTMSGEVLSRIDDGVTTHLVARYEVADPRGAHAFKAVIQGESDDKTGKYEMNGIVTWGWMLGAHVRVMFERIAPCEYGERNLCFQGTIEIERR